MITALVQDVSGIFQVVFSREAGDILIGKTA